MDLDGLPLCAFYGGTSTFLFNSTEEHNTIINNDRHCSSDIYHCPPSASTRLIVRAGGCCQWHWHLLSAVRDASGRPHDVHRCGSHLPPISIGNALRRSSLFVGPPHSSSVRFVYDHTLRPRPSSVRIRGTAFLSFIANCCPKLEHSLKNTEINTTINQQSTR